MTAASAMGGEMHRSPRPARAAMPPASEAHRGPVSDLMLWSGAGVLALAAHVAAAALLINAPAPVPNGVEEVFAVAVAPEMFAAPEELVSDVVPDVVAEGAPAPTPPVPDAVENVEPPELSELPPEADPLDMPDLAEAAPPPELVEDIPEPPPVPEEILPESPTPPEVAMAPPPPPRPEPPKPEPKPEPKRVEARKPPPKSGAAPAAPDIQAKVATQAAAPQNAPGSAGDPRAVTRWVDQVNRVVARHMKRWRNPGAKMQLMMAVTYDSAGRITGVRINGSTGDSAVDGSLQTHARALPDLPPPPSGQGSTSLVPLVLTPG